MSKSQARHAAPNPDRNEKALRTVRFWAAPDKVNAWKTLHDAGVDLINTDDLKGGDRRTGRWAETIEHELFRGRQGFGDVLPGRECAVVLAHQRCRCVVAHGPERRDDGPGPGRVGSAARARPPCADGGNHRARERSGPDYIRGARGARDRPRGLHQRNVCLGRAGGPTRGTGRSLRTRL